MSQPPDIDHLKGDPPRHEEGDPATLPEDPAQVYPTGGAGLIDPNEEAERDAGDLLPDPPEDGPAEPPGEV